MPSVKAKTQYGSVTFNYNISTPTNANAKSIDKSLPVVLWLHPVYIAGIIFHPQFADPNLRRYNLVCFDARLHGETTSSKPVKTWGRDEAAEDAARFMEALKLPPCHVVGLSMGACVGITLANLYPERVLSLLSLSPLPPVEPAEVAAGREEIAEYWMEGMRNNDKGAIQDAVYGALQLGVSNHSSSLIDALVAHTVPLATKNWGVKELDQYKMITCDFFTQRRPQLKERLAKVRCPVRLVHSGGDIAYTTEDTLNFRDSLVEAGVQRVSIVEVPNACHFGSLTHPKELNKVIDAHLRAVVPGADNLKVPENVVSPFEKELRKHGLEDDESDIEYI